jgi:spore maturation protein CgeB
MDSTKKLRVLFIADLDCESASGRQRLWAFQQNGAEVYRIAKDGYKRRGHKVLGRLAKAFASPGLDKRTKKMATDIIHVCAAKKPHIVWIEWPREIKPKLLQDIKQASPESLLLSFQDDNPWGQRIADRWTWKNYFSNIPLFDLHLVKRDQDIEHLKRYGAKGFHFWKHGIFPPLFYPPVSPVEKKYAVTFVGTCIDNRTRLIEYLLEKGIPVHVFGGLWEKRSDLPARFPGHFHGLVQGEEYAAVIRQSKICLGLVSSSNHDEWTMRTFEVPACAGTLLAERTPTHEALFEEEKEAMFFSSPEECATKIKLLLVDPGKCRTIGENAYQRCVRNNYTLESQMNDLLNRLLLV